LKPRILLLLLPLFVYLFLPTRNFYWDGVAFAINIENASSVAALVHPSHLLYNLGGAGLYRLSQMVGIHTRALYILQTVNSLLAGLCVPLFYKCLRLRNVSATLGVPAALVFAFSATWWKFATDANAYVPSIFFILCAYVLVERRNSPVLAGLAHSGAMMLHELGLLFMPVALLRLRKDPRSMFAYAATAVIPVAAAYLMAYRAFSKDMALPPGLFSWVTSHAADSGFRFNPVTDAWFSIRATLRLFFGGRVGDFADNGISRAALAVLIVAAALFFVVLWRTARTGQRLLAPPRHLVVWIGVYAAFLFVWMPENTFYRLFYLPPLIAILAVTLRDAPASRAGTWLLALVLLGWNFCFLIYPQSWTNFNAPLRFALAQQNTWVPGTPIVYRVFHSDLWTISYFNPQTSWIGMDRTDLDDLERDLEYARGHNTPLWLEQDAYLMIASNPNGQQWLTLHERPGELLEFKDQRHHFLFHSVR
jgi:hypothetical protein